MQKLPYLILVVSTFAGFYLGKMYNHFLGIILGTLAFAFAEFVLFHYILDKSTEVILK